MSTGQKDLHRIIRKMGAPHVVEQLAEQISGSELNSLLLEVFGEKAKTSSPADLLKRYQENRFVKPSELPVLALKRLELEVLEIAEQHAFAPVQLSPVAPLGSCSIVATVDQNKIVSALRGTEVVADATNLLALHISDGLKTGILDNKNHILHFSATHRHVRAQHFNAPGMLAHFHLFCMVSSGLDQGSYHFEISSFWDHIKVYQHLFRELFKAEIKVGISIRKGYSDPDGFLQRLLSGAEQNPVELTISSHPEEEANAYYKGIQFTIIADIQGHWHNIGDGGFVDWTEQLLGNKKQRLLISAIGLERLCSLISESID